MPISGKGINCLCRTWEVDWWLELFVLHYEAKTILRGTDISHLANPGIIHFVQFCRVFLIYEKYPAEPTTRTPQRQL